MYQQIRRAFVASALALFCFAAYAQQTVKGTVKDANGEPMIGVTIATGSGAGAVTDLDGNFTIQNASPSTVLNISYVGYKSQQVKVGSQSNFNIVLQEDNTTLEDVVVIGYGTMKRKDLTGAVASVTGEKLAANPVANVAQALQGQLPGVSVASQDGRPGATMSIRVRGGGSITQSNDPLYIVDGVQVSDINDIPADNIESIDVLKDAASTAIYGARGANGVILVTTKGSKGEGSAKVKYNMYYQIKTPSYTPEVQDAYNYVLHNWSYAKAYGDTYGEGVASYFGLGSANGNHLNEYKNIGVHNYVDDVMQTAHSWNHDLSLSGGNQNTKYYASLNYMTDEGNRIKTGMNRWNANFKISQKITKTLTFDADLRYSEMKFEGTNFDYAAGNSVYGFRPIDKPLGSDEPSDLGMGSASVEDISNPLSVIDNYSSTTRRQRLRGMGTLTWNVIKGLTAKTELSLSRNWSKKEDWDGGKSANPYNKTTLTQGDGYGLRWATTLNYQVQGLGENHDLSFLAGNEVLASKSNSSSMIGAGYPAEYTQEQAFGFFQMYNMIGDSQIASAAKKVTNTTYSIGEPKHTLSWFGRANYSLMGRYLFTATFRADGSSNFAPNHHWGYFPAGAVAWRINDEPFMESAKDWLDNLKLRLSIGTSGNDNIDASLWKEYWVPAIDWSSGTRKVTFSPGEVLANPDLKWETTISRNLGFDFSFWNGKLRGSIDAYWNSTKDILMRVPVAESTGHSYQYQNVGETSNKGLELAIFYEIIRSKDFNLSVNATYNYNKNNVEKVLEGVNADTNTNWGSSMKRPYNDYIIREGEPVGTIYGYKSNGFYTVDDFTVSNGVWTLKQGVPDMGSNVTNYPGSVTKLYNLPEGQVAFPGMVKFADTDGDGTITEEDCTVVGHTMAEHTGGININANYKGFDFSAGFTYQIGGDVYNANAMHSMMGNKDTSFGWNRLGLISDCWKIYDVNASGDLEAVTDATSLAALNASAKHALPYAEYGLVSSEFIEDASYLRLNTLTLGYTLPRNLTKKVGISNLRVYFTGGNLFCITGYNGSDPDVNTRPGGNNGFPTPNYDWNSYPRARTYTFGLNVTF